MRAQRVLDQLSDLNPDAVLFDNMESALVGVGYVSNSDPIAVYSMARIYEELSRVGLSQEDAEEYVTIKFLAQHAQKNAPVILDDSQEG
jgi:hypothetical protein